MSVDPLLRPAPVVSAQTAPLSQSPVTTDAERWSAWRARGVAHDRAVRLKLAVTLPIVAIVAIVLYTIFAL